MRVPDPLKAFGSSLAALALVTSSALAASFGVPPGPGMPSDGWFILVGKDAVDEAQSNFFGDITRELRLFIEVTGRDLEICVYDPGHYDGTLIGPPLRELDFEFTPGPGRSAMSFELFDPAGTSIKLDDTSFGPDTDATNDALWCFYDTNAGDPNVTAGVYEFVVQMVDGPGLDQHANIFGVQVNDGNADYNAYAYYATVGHSQQSGAGLVDGSVRMYPWIVEPSPAVSMNGGDACAMDIASYDLDAPVGGMFPPSATVLTALVPPFMEDPFAVSEDQVLDSYGMYNLAGINAGDDHGIYTLEYRQLTDDCGGVNCVLEPNLGVDMDFNAFSFQIYDAALASPSLFYPITFRSGLFATYKPRRLYLPNRGSSAPAKESVRHRILNIPPGGAFIEGQTVTIDVELSIPNPTGYDLDNVVGQTFVNPFGDVTPPVNVNAAGGQNPMASSTGKTIDFSFNRIRAGETGVVTYSVDYTPGVPGFYYLTGDGSDFVGGATPTQAQWDTDFAAQAESGAPCMIQMVVDPAPCVVDAEPAAVATACGDQVFTLDGSSSIPVSACPSGLEYMWSGPGIAAPAWLSDPTLPVSTTTPGTVTYTLEVRCIDDNSCTDSQTVDVDISDGQQPAADAGGDLNVGSCDLPIVIGTPGDTVVNSYTWTSTFPIGNLLAAGEDVIPQPTFIEATPGVYDLTLTVASLVDPACTAVDVISVTVSDGIPVGDIGNGLRAAKSGSGSDVELGWPLGLVQPDRYNVHRAGCAGLSPPSCKLDIDKTGLPGSYVAPILNPAEITVGAYTDPGAVDDLANPLFLYEAFGRDCVGASDIK